MSKKDLKFWIIFCLCAVLIMSLAFGLTVKYETGLVAGLTTLFFSFVFILTMYFTKGIDKCVAKEMTDTLMGRIKEDIRPI